LFDIVHRWAADWAFPAAAVLDLMTRIGIGYEPPQRAEVDGWSEDAISHRLRLDAAKAGILAYRNNVGALKDDSGRWLRFGLCNDTKALNEKIKSADLIGIKPVLITPAHVGYTIGQFWSREVKEFNWRYKGAGREVAQLKWIEIITSKGGDAAFSTGCL